MSISGDAPVADDPVVPAPGPTPAPARKRRRLSVLDKVLLAVGAAFAVFALVGAVSVHVVTNKVFGDVERIPDVFGPLNAAARPEKAPGTEKALTFLVVGADSRADQGGRPAPAAAGRERTTVVMLVRVAPDKKSAAVVSIPHNSLVALPGGGTATVGAAYRSGGGTLLVQTVERLTKLRVDHFAVVDFAGFRQVTDALGGVELRLGPADGRAAGSPKERLDGAAALAYLRRSDDRVGADLDQVHRQQAVMRALMTQALSRGLLANPAGTLKIADSVAAVTSVDDTLSNGGLRSLVLSMRNLRPGGITFATAPVTVSGRSVRLTRDADRLWAAVADDDVASYVTDR
jgi:LCP family protein required for cell wall assembly